MKEEMKMEAVEIPSRMIVEFFLEMQKRYKLSTIMKRIERPMSARMEMRGLAHSMHAVGVSADAQDDSLRHAVRFATRVRCPANTVGSSGVSNAA